MWTIIQNTDSEHQDTIFFSGIQNTIFGATGPGALRNLLHGQTYSDQANKEFYSVLYNRISRFDWLLATWHELILLLSDAKKSYPLIEDGTAVLGGHKGSLRQLQLVPPSNNKGCH